MADAILRRTTFIVPDVEATAKWYCDVFGWTIWYDNELTPDDRFPPHAPAGTKARLILIQVEDPEIGMLGLMQYYTDTPEAPPVRSTERVGLVEPILVINTENVDEIHERVKGTAATIHAAPVDWEVPSHDGKGVIKLRTMSIYDPNGVYIEVNKRG